MLQSNRPLQTTGGNVDGMTWLSSASESVQCHFKQRRNLIQTQSKKTQIFWHEIKKPDCFCLITWKALPNHSINVYSDKHRNVRTAFWKKQRFQPLLQIFLPRKFFRKLNYNFGRQPERDQCLPDQGVTSQLASNVLNAVQGLRIQNVSAKSCILTEKFRKVICRIFFIILQLALRKKLYRNSS